jgi:predicted patatin/cPLA2 family phospholipase
MNCNSDLIVCIDNSNKNKCKPQINKIYEKIFNNIIQKIKNNHELSKEDFDFIESSTSQQKMIIIREYDKKQKENIHILETIKNSALR